MQILTLSFRQNSAMPPAEPMGGIDCKSQSGPKIAMNLSDLRMSVLLSNRQTIEGSWSRRIRWQTGAKFPCAPTIPSKDFHSEQDDEASSSPCNSRDPVSGFSVVWLLDIVSLKFLRTASLVTAVEGWTGAVTDPSNFSKAAWYGLLLVLGQRRLGK